MKLPRYRTGDSELDLEIARLVDRAAPARNADLVFEMIASALRFGIDGADRGDMKIANSALKELRESFFVFALFRGQRKVAMFGSARTERDDPLYEQALSFAGSMAQREWMVITGAGPGIMEAGIEGAGTESSFGVGIQLPFEATTSELLAEDRLVNFRYFFTRKLEFVKEADGFVLLPGGYGTMDEAFELLTLVQTGRTKPAPIVLLDVPGGTYWQTWREFVERELMRREYISEHDLCFVAITDDVDVAVDEIAGFYTNYQSERFVGSQLVLRMRRAPDAETLAALNAEFPDILVRGSIERIEATSIEIADDDHLDLERIALRFDRRNWARLRELVDRLNGRSSHH